MPPKSKYHRTEGQAIPPIPALQYKGALSDLAQGIIFGLAYAGIQQTEVAKVCGTAASTITRTVAAVSDRLDVAVDDKPSPDKPRAEPSSDPFQTPSRASRDVGDNSPGELAVAKEMTRKRTNGEYAHQNSRDIRVALHDLHGISYSVRHVQRLVHEAGGRWVRRPTTCPLNAERMTKRVAACTRLLKQLEERPDLKNKIVFSDESMLRAEDTRFMCLQRPGEKAEPRRKARWAPQVHVWGAIGVGFRQLVFLEGGTVDAPFYQEVITKFLLAKKETDFVEAKRVLQQDGASAHTAKATQTMFQEKGVEVLEWPAWSPDLNPIENLWSILKRRMDASKLDNKDDLIEEALAAWESIPQESIDHLCLSFERRLRRCIENQGDDCQI